MVDRYDEVNRDIYRIESEQEPTVDAVLVALKKECLALKDGIARMLTKPRTKNVAASRHINRRSTALSAGRLA